MKQTTTKAKINYIELSRHSIASVASYGHLAIQFLFRTLIFSIVVLKNLSLRVFFFVSNTAKQLLNKQSPPKQVALHTPIEPVFEELYKKDINLFKTMVDKDANANIESSLYDYKIRKTLFEEENNQTEKQWRTRLLFETTYRGNIIMYYDAFRMSFCYYSDEQIVPYVALQHAAMRYVTRFRCRNFFIDMDTFPENPIIEVLKKEDETLKSKTKETPIENKQKQNNNPVFAKLKNYREVGSKDNNKPKHPFSNKFVRIGKMCEFNILQKPPSKKIEAINSLLFSDNPLTSVTDFFDDLSIDVDVGVKKEPVIDKNNDSNPFSTDQPKMSSYQLFKMMKKNQEKGEATII